MEIKNVYDMSVANVQKVAKTASQPQEPANTKQVSSKGSSKDTVSISAEASFKSKLNNVTKSYVTSARSIDSVSQTRMNTLKESYSGDNCPVSSINIATSMMQSVCGYGI